MCSCSTVLGETGHTHKKSHRSLSQSKPFYSLDQREQRVRSPLDYLPLFREKCRETSLWKVHQCRFSRSSGFRGPTTNDQEGSPTSNPLGLCRRQGEVCHRRPEQRKFLAVSIPECRNIFGF